MKDLNKLFLVLFFINLTFLCYADQDINSKYYDLSLRYLEKGDIKESERYLFFIKSSEEGLSERVIDLEIDIRKKTDSSEDFRNFLEDMFENHKNRKALEELLLIEKQRYFSYNEFKDLLKHRLEVYPDNFLKEQLSNIIFFKSGGVDIMQANIFRKYSDYYFRYFSEYDFSEELADIVFRINAFELQRYDECVRLAERFPKISGKDEILWFIDFFFGRKSDYEIKDDFFRVFSLFCEQVFKGKENDNILKTLKLSENVEFYRNLVLAFISEEKGRNEDAVFYYVKSADNISKLEKTADPYTKGRIEACIERLRLKTEKKKIERRVIDLEASGEYNEAYKMAEYLDAEKKAFYQSRILYYYFYNFEKVLDILERNNINTIETQFIKGQIYLKSSLYEKAEKIFLEIIEKDNSGEYFESALSNLSQIYKAQGNTSSMKRFAYKIWEKHGNTQFSGKIFLDYAELLENAGNSVLAGDIIKFIMFYYSDKEDIFAVAQEKYEKNLMRLRNDELKRDINNSILKLKSDAQSTSSRYTTSGKRQELRSPRRRRRFSSDENSDDISENIDETGLEDTNEMDISEEDNNPEIETPEFQEDTKEFELTEEQDLTLDYTDEVILSTHEVSVASREFIRPDNSDFLKEEEEKRKELIKNRLPGLIYNYFANISELEDWDSQIELAEKLIQYSSEVDMPELRNIATIGLAEASLAKIGDIEKVISFFYQKIRDYVKKYSLDKEKDKDDIISDFYVKAVEFFRNKGFIREAYELCENYYKDMDPSFKTIEVLKQKLELSLLLGDILREDIETIIRKDKEYADSFIIENELFENSSIIELGKKLDDLVKTSEIIKKLKEKKEIKEKYIYFRDNNMKKKISESYYDIIGAYSDSFEVYNVCWNALVEKEKFNDAGELYKILKTRFSDRTADIENQELFLKYIFDNFEPVKILDFYAVLSPVREEFLEKIDLSVFSDDFISKLILIDKNNKLLKRYYLEILLEKGNSSEIIEFSGKNPEFTSDIFDYYLQKRDYELLDFFYSEFPGISDNVLKNHVNIYRSFVKKKNQLNTSDSSSGENILDIIKMARKLGLYDEASNYAIVYNRITGNDVKSMIEDIELEKKISEIESSGSDNDYLIAKKMMIYVENGMDTSELEITPDIKAKASEISNIVEMLSEFSEEDTTELNISEEVIISDTEEIVISVESFHESVKKKKKDKAFLIGEKLVIQGELDIIPELGRLYEEKRDFRKAEELYKRFIVSNISDIRASELQYKLGLIAMKERDEEKAISLFERLLRYFPDGNEYTVKAENRISQIIDEGIKGSDFQDELALFDKKPEYDEVDRFADISDNIDEIKEEISKTNDEYRLSQLHYKLAEIYFEKFEDYDNALSNYLKARDYGEQDSDLIEKIADCYIKQRKYDQAVEYYENYAETLVDPEEKAEITLRIIKIYVENLKQYSEGLEKINVYISDYSFTEAYYEVLYYKAQIYEEHYRDYTEAINSYNVLVPEFGSDYAAKAQFRIAYIYERYLKEYDKAETAYNKVINDFTDFDLKTQAEEAIRRMLEDGKIKEG